MYYVRLKPSNLRNYSRTKCEGKGHLLIPGAGKAGGLKRKSQREKRETGKTKI